MKMIPLPARGLHEHARFSVGLVDAPFDARRLAQQRLLFHGARIRIDRHIRIGLLRCRRERKDEHAQEREQGDCISHPHAHNEAHETVS
ncbi:MAG: hypothetical protein WA642_01965 [Steroidobacteraceae bacterium]